MNRKVSQEFETPRFSYARVEGALAAVFDLDSDRQRGPLRSRLKHLQRLGLPGLEAGKGARVQYSKEQAAQWLLALLMAQLGLDPVLVVKAVKSNWRSLAPQIKVSTDQVAKRGNSMCLGLRPRVMLGAWEEGGPSLQLFMFRRRSIVPVPDPRDADELPRKADEDPDNWLCMIDFTRPYYQLELALR